MQQPQKISLIEPKAPKRVEYYTSDIEGKEALLIIERRDNTLFSVKLLPEEIGNLVARLTTNGIHVSTN